MTGPEHSRWRSTACSVTCSRRTASPTSNAPSTPRLNGAARETTDSILAAYPYLEPEDIDEALRYAAFLAGDETVELAR